MRGGVVVLLLMATASASWLLSSAEPGSDLPQLRTEALQAQELAKQPEANNQRMSKPSLRQIAATPDRTAFTFLDPSVRHQVEARLTTAGKWDVVPLPITPPEYEWLGAELDLHDLRVSPAAAGRIVDAQFHGCTQPSATLRANLMWAVYCRRLPSGVIQGATVDGRSGAFHIGVPQPPEPPPAYTPVPPVAVPPSAH